MLSGELAPAAARATAAARCHERGRRSSGKVAFIQRGELHSSCRSSDNAEAAGAIAVVMVNNEPGVFQMGGDGSSPLPGLMISQADGATLLGAQGTLTGSLLLPPFSSDDEAFADFLSSRGPSVIDGALKPDISAPGVSIVSANGGSGIGGVANTGTSMASPFVAGAAAVTRQAFPSLEPNEVKALMMSANQPLRSSDGDLMPIAYQGSGRLALANIVAQTAFLRSEDAPDSVSLSFGHIEAVETTTTTRTAALVNPSATPRPPTTSASKKCIPSLACPSRSIPRRSPCPHKARARPSPSRSSSIPTPSATRIPIPSPAR